MTSIEKIHVSYVCDRCGQVAVMVDGKWQHAEAADAAFCQLVMRREWPDAEQR